MVAVHHAAAEIAVDGVRSPIPMLSGGRKCVRQVLIQRASGMQTHQLHSKANAKNRLVRQFVERLKDGHLKGLPRGIERIRPWVRWLAPLRHVRIVTSAQDDGITYFEQVSGATRNAWKNNRHTASPINHLGIPAAHLITLADQIGGDADDRTVASEGS
jgi:hypothetical protein